MCPETYTKFEFGSSGHGKKHCEEAFDNFKVEMSAIGTSFPKSM